MCATNVEKLHDISADIAPMKENILRIHAHIFAENIQVVKYIRFLDDDQSRGFASSGMQRISETKSNESSIKFPCGNCSSIFSRKHNLQYHLKFECNQPARMQCPHCGYRTRHPSNVRAHVRRIHPGNPVYVIDVCKTDVVLPIQNF